MFEMVQPELETVHVNTQGMCFLCLNYCIQPSKSSDPSHIPSSDQGFAELLRYLHIDITSLFNCPAQFLIEVGFDKEFVLRLTLCPECSLTVKRIDKCLSHVELIRCKLGSCIKSVITSIRTGEECPEKVREYKKRMKPDDLHSLFNVSFAHNLKNETMKQCCYLLEREYPEEVNTTYQAPAESVIWSSVIVQNPAYIPDMVLQNQQFKVSSDDDDEIDFNKDKNDCSSDDEASDSSIEHVQVAQQIRPSVALKQVVDLKQSIPLTKTTAALEQASVLLRKAPVVKKQSFEAVKKAPVALERGSVPPKNAPVPLFSHVAMQNELCPVCKISQFSKVTLQDHMISTHPEVVVSKYLPPAMSPCSAQLFENAMDEMLLKQTKNVKKLTFYKCCYCSSVIDRKESFQHHMLSKHKQSLSKHVEIFFQAQKNKGKKLYPSATSSPIAPPTLAPSTLATSLPRTPQLPHNGPPPLTPSPLSVPLFPTPLHQNGPPPLAPSPLAASLLPIVPPNVPSPHIAPSNPPPNPPMDLEDITDSDDDRLFIDLGPDADEHESAVPNDPPTPSTSQASPHTAPFTCTVCGKVHTNYPHLARHMSVHAAKTHSCPYCFIMFTTMGRLKTHLIDSHLVAHYLKRNLPPGTSENMCKLVVNKAVKKWRANFCSYCDRVMKGDSAGQKVKRHMINAHYETFLQKIQDGLLEQMGDNNNRG